MDKSTLAPNFAIADQYWSEMYKVIVCLVPLGARAEKGTIYTCSSYGKLVIG